MGSRLSLQEVEALRQQIGLDQHILQVCADDAAILTGIGIGTAFGLLVAMMVVILVIRLVVTRLHPGEAPGSFEGEAEAKEKALAAVVAVTTLLAEQSRTDGA